ncbi:MAG: LLM class flavin-dependent oxidoreductase, partial [Candidatus Rokuibacteriota bacterium]
MGADRRRRAAGDEGRDRVGAARHRAPHPQRGRRPLAAPGGGDAARHALLQRLRAVRLHRRRPARVVRVTSPRFGLNRFDARSVDAFAADVRRAEALGWDAALQPDSQLRRRDTYVLLAAAARATERITLGPLLANPVNRHPTVTASSIATIDELAPGRVLLGWGVGDTAVRLAGLRPARVKELEASTRLMRALLDGEAVEVGAARPARLPHHRPVPIWIAAGGPRTLRMAGGV